RPPPVRPALLLFSAPTRRRRSSTLFPYTTLFRSRSAGPQGGTFSDPQRRRACRLAGARRPIRQKGDDRMKRANPAVVGGFVVGAIVLVVIGLLVFGGIGWFAQTNTYIAYFPGSVKGLQVGAPVDFRGGTKIGRASW